MRVLISCCVTFRNMKKMESLLSEHKSKIKSIITDSSLKNKIVLKYAKKNSIPVEIFKPDFDRYRMNSYTINHIDMLNNCDLVIIIWKGIERSLKHLINQTELKRKQYRIYYV